MRREPPRGPRPVWRVARPGGGARWRASLRAIWRGRAQEELRMADAIDFAPSHLGVCVASLERSLRFYCDGLGFAKAETYAVGNEYRAGLDVEGDVDLVSQFIRREGLALELLAYRSPAAQGRPSARRNQLGYTHLSFVVEDVDAAARHLVACGGTLLPETRTGRGDPAAVQIVFVADPDGVRIELMSNPAPLG